jgi:hypothetical protein
MYQVTDHAIPQGGKNMSNRLNLLSENPDKVNLEQAISYYRSYLNAICTSYLTLDQVYSLVINEHNAFNNKDIDWYLRAVSKLSAMKLQNSELKYVSNTKARELGRNGEQLVVNALKGNKWKILTKPSKSLRPRYGNSTINYDIKATWQDNKPRYIEIKTINDNCPFICLHYKFKYRFESKYLQEKYGNHYLAFVWRGEIYYVRSKNIKFIGGIPNCNNPKYNFTWVVDPQCLTKINSERSIS